MLLQEDKIAHKHIDAFNSFKMFGDKFDGANGDAKGVDTLIEGVDVFAWGLTHKWVRLMHDGVV